MERHKTGGPRAFAGRFGCRHRLPTPGLALLPHAARGRGAGGAWRTPAAGRRWVFGGCCRASCRRNRHRLCRRRHPGTSRSPRPSWVALLVRKTPLSHCTHMTPHTQVEIHRLRSPSLSSTTKASGQGRHPPPPPSCLAFTEREGRPTHLNVHGRLLAAATDKGCLKVRGTH
jgi:hypothetical protein